MDGKETAGAARAKGGGAFFVYCDVTDRTSVDRAPTGAIARYGEFDVLSGRRAMSEGGA